jgi:hypothetical protein
MQTILENYMKSHIKKFAHPLEALVEWAEDQIIHNENSTPEDRLWIRNAKDELKKLQDKVDSLYSYKY